MRGKAVRNETGTSWQGITPAYAGKSLLLRQQFFSRWDHPRVCGEKFSAHSARRYRTGSPPRMRGKATRPHAKPRPSRITPAYAGKRRHVQYRPSGNKDHPRVCGEKWKDVPKEIKLKGSPPRMRGKGRVASELARDAGITPAYAGKSKYRECKDRVLKDHPRVCGEKGKPGGKPRAIIGSPPRMRGKAESNPLGALERRITPAYAGKRIMKGEKK